MNYYLTLRVRGNLPRLFERKTKIFNSSFRFTRILNEMCFTDILAYRGKQDYMKPHNYFTLAHVSYSSAFPYLHRVDQNTSVNQETTFLITITHPNSHASNDSKAALHSLHIDRFIESTMAACGEVCDGINGSEKNRFETISTIRL
jgi:hypothetical protein